MDPQKRAELSSAEVNNLPDSAFAYIEPGGKKDDGGKTTPRKLRHYPIQDKAHADNALDRADAAVKGDDATAKGIAEKALPAIKSAVDKFGAKQSNSADPEAEERDAPTPEDYGVMAALKDANLAIAHAKAKQLADPDYKTDPDDQEVMDAIEKAGKAIDKAIVAQSKDGHEDARSAPAPTPSARNWATPRARELFGSVSEWTPPQTVDVQVRMQADDANSHLANFHGFPSPTSVTYAVRDWLGEYDETMHPGVWAKTIQESRDIPTFLNHNMDGIPLASTGGSPPTKALAESKRGLQEDSVFDRRCGDTNSVCVQLERGVLSKMSVTFRAIKETWNEDYTSRGVVEGALYETSIVTFPASPTADGELVDAMRSALGREGRSLWLAIEEPSIRSALPTLAEHREAHGEMDDLLERALRALARADEVVGRSNGAHGRARTFLVASAILELRAGKTLSAKNEGLIKQAVGALGAADKHHQKAAEALTSVLDSQASAEGDGTDNGTPPGKGDPILPQDGAGPRSIPPAVAQARQQVERMRRR